jgi:hypothetical protein
LPNTLTELADAIESVVHLLEGLIGSWEDEDSKALVPLCPKNGAPAGAMLYIPAWVQGPLAEAVTAMLPSLTGALDITKVGDSAATAMGAMITAGIEKAIGAGQNIAVYAEKLAAAWNSKFMQHSALITNSIAELTKLCSALDKYSALTQRKKLAQQASVRRARQVRAAFWEDASGAISRNDRKAGFAVEGFAALTDQVLPSEDWLAAFKKTTNTALRDMAGDSVVRAAAVALAETLKKKSEKNKDGEDGAKKSTPARASTNDLDLSTFEGENAHWRAKVSLGPLEEVSGALRFASIHAMYSTLVAVSTEGEVFEMRWSGPCDKGLHPCVRSGAALCDVVMLRTSTMRATAICKGSRCETWSDDALIAALVGLEETNPAIHSVREHLSPAAESDSFKIRIEGASSAAPAASPAQPAAPLADQPVGTWSCPVCTMFNGEAEAQCTICGTQRPEDVVIAREATVAAAVAPLEAASASAVQPSMQHIFENDPVVDVAVSSLTTVVLCESGHVYWWGIAPSARTLPQLLEESPYEVGCLVLDKTKAEWPSSVGFRVAEDGAPAVCTVTSKPADQLFAKVALADKKHESAALAAPADVSAAFVAASTLSGAPTVAAVPSTLLPASAPADWFAAAGARGPSRAQHWHVGEFALLHQQAKSVLILAYDDSALLFDKGPDVSQDEVDKIVALFRGFRIKELAQSTKVPIGAAAYLLGSHLLLPPRPDELIGQDFVVNGVSGATIKSAPDGGTVYGTKPIGRRVRVVDVERNAYKIVSDWQLVPSDSFGYVPRELVRPVDLSGGDVELRKTTAAAIDVALLTKVLPQCRIVRLESIRHLPSKVFRAPQLCFRPSPDRVPRRIVLNDREIMLVVQEGSALVGVPVFGSTPAFTIRSESSTKVQVSAEVR